jgi:hypothetical protein
LDVSIAYASDDVLARCGGYDGNKHFESVNTVVMCPMFVPVDGTVADYTAAYSKATYLAQQVVDILRLITNDDVGVLGVELVANALATPAIRKTWERGFEQEMAVFLPKRFRFTSPDGDALTDAQLGQLNDLLVLHIVDEMRVPGWDVAMRRFRDVYERHNPNDPELILVLAVAFEALFLNDSGDSKSELGYRLRLRAARFLREDLGEREEVFDILRDMYDYRSRIAHGATLSSLRPQEQNRLLRVLERCPMLLKETFLAILEGRGPWNRKGVDLKSAWREVELGKS